MTENPTIWTYIINGITSIVIYLIYGSMPNHTEMQLATTFVTWISNGLGLVFIIFVSNFNFIIPAVLFGFILFVVEPSQFVVKVGMFIIKAIK